MLINFCANIIAQQRKSATWMASVCVEAEIGFVFGNATYNLFDNLTLHALGQDRKDASLRFYGFLGSEAENNLISFIIHQAVL